MEFKKKTIIWEDNNEPPKNYIWVKSDGNAYEFNHTTRQWEKIMSSSGSGSGSNSSSNSNTFFQLATIQPNRYLTFPPDSDTITLIDIENLDLNTLSNYLENDKNITFFYSKEEIAKLGVSLEELEALECFTFGNVTPTENNSIPIDNSVITDNFIIKNLGIMNDDEGITDIEVSKMRLRNGYTYFIMRCAYGDNNNYTIISYRAVG